MTNALQLQSVDRLGRPIELRPAAAADSSFFARVYAGGREEELAPVPWPEEEKAAFLDSQFEAQSVHYAANYPGAQVDLIMVGGRPAGRLFVNRTDQELQVVDIGLLPEFRGAGVGELLMRRLQDEAAESARRIVLHVEVFNPARRLYDRLGFVEAGGDAIYRRLEWVRGSAG
jgi:ribosomal protein S18 acetylase RimI-like enzyme